MDTETVRIIFAVAFWAVVIGFVGLMLFVWSEVDIRFRSWSEVEPSSPDGVMSKTGSL